MCGIEMLKVWNGGRSKRWSFDEYRLCERRLKVMLEGFEKKIDVLREIWMRVGIEK